MKKKIIVFFALAIIAAPSVCLAIYPAPGPYVFGFLGVTSPVDMDVDTIEYGFGGNTFHDKIDFDPSLNTGGGGGYDFGMLRIEGELSYKNGEMSSITEKTSQTRYANVDGQVGVFAVLCNIFLDFHNASMVTPYIGGGGGLATIYLDDTYGTDSNTGFRTRLYRSDDDTVFAYQFGAGIEIALTQMLSLDIGYRYFGTSKAKFDDYAYATTEFKFESHNAAIGIRVLF